MLDQIQLLTINISLLASLFVAHLYLIRAFGIASRSYRVAMGVLFGIGTISMMLNPYFANASLYVDGRPIVLLLAGLFGGPLVAAIAAGLALVFRIVVGGDGMLMGVVTILASTAFGTWMHALRRRHEWLLSLTGLWVQGLAVTLGRLYIMLLHPDMSMEVAFTHEVLPILALFPLEAVLLGKLMKDHEEKLATEDLLREREERYRKFFEENTAMMLQLDPDDGRIIDANESFVRSYGYTREQLQRMNIRDINPLSSEEIQANLERARDAQAYYRLFEHRNADGSRRFVEAYTSPMDVRSGRVVFAIINDVTDRIRSDQKTRDALEKAERSDRIKDLFIANISHEIRTPLNIILGYVNLLDLFVQGEQSEEADRMVASVTQAGDRLMRTIDMVLTFSSISAHTYEATFKVVDLTRIVERLREQIEPLRVEKGLDIRLSLDAVHPVCIDTYSVEQAVMNLLDNAIKFTRRGTITVGLEEREGWAVLSVTDTGIGISEDYMKRLFSTFTQEQDGFTRPYEGIGLGLSLVKRYAEINRGRILVESTKGVGSRFELWLPIASTVEIETRELRAEIALRGT